MHVLTSQSFCLCYSMLAEYGKNDGWATRSKRVDVCGNLVSEVCRAINGVGDSLMMQPLCV